MTYISPAGNVWLHLRDEGGKAVCLELDTGEVRLMNRSIADLVKFGWREWTPEGEEISVERKRKQAAWDAELLAARKRLGL